MKKIRVIILLTLLITLSISSCSKKLVSGIDNVKAGHVGDKDSYNYLYVEAVKQKLMGNGGDALKYFEQCLLINPQSDASYYQMAQIVITNGDIVNGKKYVKMACDLKPENLWYQMILANIYYQQKNIDSAIYCYEKAIKYYPEKEDLQINLANLYTENKNFGKARSILNKFDEKYGVNENTTLSLVKNLIFENKYNEALVKVKELLKQNPEDINCNGLLAEIYRGQGENEKASDVYQQLIQRNPDNPQIQLSVCEFLLAQKNYNELFKFLNTVILNNKLSKEDKVSFLSGLIDNEDIVKSYGKNLEIVLMILEADYQDDDIILLMRPEFLVKEEKRVEAADRLEEIISVKPDNYFAWEKLLLVYYDMHDFKRLEKMGGECATRFNRSILAKILYANGAMENKNYDVALEELRKSDILAGDNKEMKLQVLTMRADIYYRMKDYTKAFQTYDEAVKLNDSDMTILNNYAYYLAEQNLKLKDAEKMAKIVIEKEKSNTTYLDTYAWVLYKRGKLKEASKIMEKIIGSGVKDDAEWYEHYGYILKKRGKCNEAVENWKKALLIDDSKTNLKKEIENCVR